MVWPSSEAGVPSTVVSLAISRRVPPTPKERLGDLRGAAPGEGHAAGDLGFAGDHGADAVVHRLGHQVVHLAALGLDPDLFKNVNPEAFVAGICFLIQRLDLLKDHRLERCALRGGLRGEGNRASQGKQSCRWSQKCTHALTAFADLLAGMSKLDRASQ